MLEKEQQIQWDACNKFAETYNYVPFSVRLFLKNFLINPKKDMEKLPSNFSRKKLTNC